MLKKMIFTYLVFVLLIAFTPEGYGEEAVLSDTTGYVMTVQTGDLTGRYLYLMQREGEDFQVLDSAIAQSGEDIVFRGKTDHPRIFYLRLQGSDKPVAFFAENSTITILPDFKNPSYTKVRGSKTQDEYENYLSQFNSLNEEKKKLYDDYMQARNSGDKNKMDLITKQYDDIAATELEMNKHYVAAHRSSYVTPYVIRTNMFYSLDLAELKNLVDKLDPVLDNSGFVQEMKKHITVLERVAIGQKYTDFTMLTPDGESLSLSDLVGKNYLLVDFWASWCGPCRRENPNVVSIYDDYHGKGFDILGVSFDTNEANWKKAIESDGLAWHQVSDLKGWGSTAGKLYGIKSIPHTMLLDPDGIIIAKNLRGEELRKKLDQLLN